MRSLWFYILICAALFVACNDDGSDFATRASDDEPSEVKSSSSAKSSSSYRAKSSSSVTQAVFCKTEAEDVCEYGTLTDERDGQTYKTVKIGDQWWMAENLNYAALEPTAWEDSSSFCYDNKPAHCKIYGRLYTWAAAVGKSDGECGYGKKCSLPAKNVQGVCPDGWHLPSERDIIHLIRATDEYSHVGTNLKAFTGWLGYGSGPGNGTDDYGFSGLPSGIKTFDADYRYEGIYTYFWSSTEIDAYHAHTMSLRPDRYLMLFDYTKFRAYSVRCLKDSADDWDDDDDDSTDDVTNTVTMTMPCKTKTKDDCEYGSLTDKRDGRTYRTVKIGDLWWMAENLSYPYLQPTSKQDSSSFCVNNDSALCDTLGRLYLWSAAMDSAALFSSDGKGCGMDGHCSANGVVRGVCPEGWHLPDTVEFSNLVIAAGGELEAGLMLKSTSGWDYDKGKRGGIDAFGFTAVPAGLWVENENNPKDYRAQGASAIYWTSTMDHRDNNQAHNWEFRDEYDDVSKWSTYVDDAYSVRCVKD